MLLKPDNLPSLTTSYRPISLISSTMKLFERVIEQKLRQAHLEQIGLINKHQSSFKEELSLPMTTFSGYPNPLWKASTEENMFPNANFAQEIWEENALRCNFVDFWGLIKNILTLKTNVIITFSKRFKVHSLSSGKVEMFPCAACHAFTPHVKAWKN